MKSNKLLMLAILISIIFGTEAKAQMVDVESGVTELKNPNEALRLSGYNSYVSFYRNNSFVGYLYHDDADMYLANTKVNGDLRFLTQNSTRLFVNNDGLIGVNTTTPNQRLHVNGGTRTRGLHLTGENYFSGGDDGVIYSDDAAGSDIFLVSNDAVIVELDKNNNEEGDFRIQDGNGAYLFYVSDVNRPVLYNRGLEIDQPNVSVSDAKTGIAFRDATATGEWRIMHSGAFFSFVLDNVRQAYVGTDGSWNVTSDRRLKENFSPLESTLNRINQLQPMRYNYKSNKDKEETIGFVAQDVLSLFPEAVSETEDGFLAVNYSMFGVLAVKAIQEQEQRIDTLESQVARLTQQLNELISK